MCTPLTAHVALSAYVGYAPRDTSPLRHRGTTSGGGAAREPRRGGEEASSAKAQEEEKEGGRAEEGGRGEGADLLSCLLSRSFHTDKPRDAPCVAPVLPSTVFEAVFLRVHYLTVL